MELISEFLQSPADAGALVLELPCVPPRPCVFVPLLMRDGGVLAAVPAGALDDAAGQGGGPELLVGPSTTLTVPLSEEEEEGALIPNGESAEVVVVDFALEIATHLSRYDPVTSPVEVLPFVKDMPHQLLVHGDALRLARAWVTTVAGERMAFYSAAEELEAEAPPALGQAPKKRAAPKAKRATTAQLAESMDSMLALLPALTQQVQEIAARQKELEERPVAPQAPAGEATASHRQPFPIVPPAVSPAKALSSLRTALGAPPKMRAPVLQKPPPVPPAPCPRR